MDTQDKAMFGIIGAALLATVGTFLGFRLLDRADYNRCLNAGADWEDGDTCKQRENKQEGFDRCLKANGVWLDDRGCSLRTKEDECILRGGTWQGYGSEPCTPAPLDEMKLCIEAGGRYDTKWKECRGRDTAP